MNLEAFIFLLAAASPYRTIPDAQDLSSHVVFRTAPAHSSRVHVVTSLLQALLSVSLFYP